MTKSGEKPFGDRLRELRDRSGHTMKSMALALGYRGASSYQRFEAPDAKVENQRRAIKKNDGPYAFRVDTFTRKAYNTPVNRTGAAPVPAYIENEAAYREAIERHIRANARKGRSARWLAEGDDRPALIERLRRSSGSFLSKMAESYEEWGSLSDKQEAAVRAAFAKADARKAELAARDAGSHHVGEVGKRQDWRLRVRSVLEFENDFGLMTITIMADEFGNVVVYKGRELGLSYDDGRAWKPAKRGDTVTLKATVKAHGERNGVRQTIIARPKVQTIESGEVA